MLELQSDGGVLRRLDLHDWAEPWYHGGLCTGPDGAIGVIGTANLPTDFGFLERPLDAAPGALFVLHLADWKGQDAFLF